MNSEQKNKIPEKTEMLLPLEFNDEKNIQKKDKTKINENKDSSAEKTAAQSHEKELIILSSKSENKKSEQISAKKSEEQQSPEKIKKEELPKGKESKILLVPKINSEDKKQHQPQTAESNFITPRQKTHSPTQEKTENNKQSNKPEVREGETSKDPHQPAPSLKKKTKVITLTSPKKRTPQAQTKNLSQNISNKKIKTKNNIKKVETKAIASIKISKDSSIGQILREARVGKNMSIEQIVQITKIKKKFINALENDNMDDLPAKVYIIAYIKTLADIYKIPSETLIEKIKDHKEPEALPDDLINHIQEGKQVNIKEEEKIKKFLQYAGIALVLLITVIVLLFYYFSGDSSKPKTTTVKTGKVNPSGKKSVKNKTTNLNTVNSDDLKIFIYPKPPTLSEAELPKK